MVDFIERIHELPDELVELIYGFTFTSDSTIETIHRAHKPPATLRVDVISRTKFAVSYYKKPFRIADENRSVLATKWLSSLPSAHLAIVAPIVVYKLYNLFTRCECFAPGAPHPSLGRFQLRNWTNLQQSIPPQFPVDKIHILAFDEVWALNEKGNLQFVPLAERWQSYEQHRCKARSGQSSSST